MDIIDEELARDFRIISEFLRRQSPDVEAHGIEELPPDTDRRLRDLAEGRVSKKERPELVSLLLGNRELESRFAGLIRETGSKASNLSRPQ